MGRSNDYEDDDDFGTDEPTNDRNPLRAVVKKLEKQVAELSAERDKLKGTVAQRNVADTLQSKGVKPGIARFILRDLDEADATPEAVEAWLKDNAEIFGITVGEQPAEKKSEESGAEGEGAAGMSAEDVAALQSIQSAEAGALPPGKLEDLEAKLRDPNLTKDDLFRLLGQPISN